MTSAPRHPPATKQSSLLIDLDDDGIDDPVLDWAEVFGNTCPVEIELGIGKGRFLMDSAARRPDTNFLGVEWAGKYLRLCHSRCQRRRLSNVRLAHADAHEFVEWLVPSDSIQAYHLYFPDPWPKKRHHKRRLFDREFLEEATRGLRVGGLFWAATDHDEYFQVMVDLLATEPRLCEIEGEWEGVPTNYEEKFVSRGKHIYRTVLQKRLA